MKRSTAQMIQNFRRDRRYHNSVGIAYVLQLASRASQRVYHNAFRRGE